MSSNPTIEIENNVEHTTLRNPSDNFLKYESKHGHITFWHKTKKKEIVIDLPYSFHILKHTFSIRGVNDGLTIFSNEIESTLNESFRVQTKKNVDGKYQYGDILFGQYADIKPKLRDNKCALFVNLYVSDQYDKLNCLRLNGKSIHKFFLFLDKKYPKLEGVTLGSESVDTPHGTFRYPDFVCNKGWQNNRQLNEDVATINDYFTKYFKSKSEEFATFTNKIKPVITTDNPFD